MRKPKQPKPLRDRLNKALLNQLQKRKITNAEAAASLGVSETYLSRVVAAMQDKVPGKTAAVRAAAKKIYKARTETRSQLAKKVLKGRLTVEEAAEQANCSARTMFRYVAAYRG